MNQASDIEKIRTIYDLMKTFDLKRGDAAVEQLISQIAAPELRGQVDRFLSGYASEDGFRALFQALPWVGLIHGLDQEQSPQSSKTELQVPDHTVFIKTAAKDRFSVVVDPKLVKGDKRSLEIIPKQRESIERYARELGVPLLFPIFWAKYQHWTVNSLDQFDCSRKAPRIYLETALKDDLSIVFGDLSFILPPPILRRTTCDAASRDSSRGSHGEFGTMTRDEVSIAGGPFLELEPLESAAIDALIDFTRVSVDKTGSVTLLTEESTDFQLVKLSTWITRHLMTSNAPSRGGVFSEDAARVSALFILDLSTRLGLTRTHMLPASTTPQATALIERAFKGSSLWTDYQASRNP